MAKRKVDPPKLNRIGEVLAQKEKTQAWLAGELEIEYRTVNRYVNNHRQPSLETIFSIAKILKVGARELINN
jgi:transcriptional regulator with XRE-family HTH domain